MQRLSAYMATGKVQELGAGANAGKLRVQFRDTGLVSWWLPMLMLFTGDSKAFYMPVVGDVVECLVDEHGESGYVVGATYSAANAPAHEAGTLGLYINGDVDAEITGNSEARIAGDMNTSVAGAAGTSIEGDSNTEVSGKSSSKVGSDSSTDVAGNSNVKIGGNEIKNITGMSAMVVGGAAAISAKTVNIDGGSAAMGGVVNTLCICPLMGLPHLEGSSNVMVSK